VKVVRRLEQRTLEVVPGESGRASG